MKLIPNHITTSLVVIGKPENVKRFVSEAFVQPGQPYVDTEPDAINNKGIPLLDFERIIQPPANIERGGCPGGAVNGIHSETGEVCWYDWNHEHWNTKWNCYSHDHFQLRWLREYSRTGEGEVYGRLDLRFDTAWAQPTAILSTIEERWDLKCHAVSQDEGGFPDTLFGDPYGEEVVNRVVTIEFDSYDTEVDEPAEVSK